MKTTIDLSDALFESAKQRAQQSQTTLSALVEEGLCRVLADNPVQPKQAFELKDASVHGQQVLLSDPRDWHKLEQDQAAARALGLPR